MPEKRLLAVFAHPDDESFGPGGTLARYAHEGRVRLLCATRGEVGTVDAHLLEGFKDIADLRSNELACAAGHLGIQDLYFLNYRDSGMPGSETSRHPESLAQAPLDEVTAKVVAHIREIKPQVVVTFDQYGGYGHPDHIQCHRATVAAFHAAGDLNQYPDAGPAYQPQKLYFSVFPKRLLRATVRLMTLLRRDPTRFGRNQDINLQEIAGWEVPTTTRVDIRAYYEVKMAAAGCHHSQGGGSAMWRTVPRPLQRRLLGYETFYRAVPPAELKGPKERDLFARVTAV